MPLPAIVATPLLGAGASVAFEFGLSRGKASKQDYQHAAVVGALPVGLSLTGVKVLARRSTRLATQVSKSRKLTPGTGLQRSSNLNKFYVKEAGKLYGPAALRVGTGLVASRGVRFAMFGSNMSQIGGHTQPTHQTSRGLSGTQRVSQLGSSRLASKRSGRCKAKYRGRRCILPAGHKGRHRYETK